MSYESKLDRKSGKFITPAQLCLLASVALHLLVLRFGIPTIKFNDESGRREVSIIELNPEQQDRLPNLSPQLNTPDTPVPDISDLPPVDTSEPAAPFAIPKDLIPGIGNNSDLPPIVIPPPPDFSNLPPITDITLPPVGDISNLPLPPEITTEDFKTEPPQAPPTTNQQPDKPANPPTQAKPTAKPESKPVEPNEAAKPQVKPTPEQIAAQKVQQSQERIRKLSQSLTKKEKGTTDEEARKNYVAWLAKVQDIEPEAIEVTGTYPRDACIRRLKGTTVYGVVVDVEGNVVALDLIKGAEYSVFDEAAGEEIIRSVLDNDTEKPKPYQITVNYEYDAEICPSLTLPSIRKQEEQQKQEQTEPKSKPAPRLTPKPETKPEPKPETKPEPEPKPAPKPEPKPAPKPKPKPVPKPESKPAPKPEPKPEPKPLPSLRDRLRDIPLPDRKPSDLKDIPLPDKPNFGK